MEGVRHRLACGPRWFSSVLSHGRNFLPSAPEARRGGGCCGLQDGTGALALVCRGLGREAEMLTVGEMHWEVVNP